MDEYLLGDCHCSSQVDRFEKALKAGQCKKERGYWLCPRCPRSKALLLSLPSLTAHIPFFFFFFPSSILTLPSSIFFFLFSLRPPLSQHSNATPRRDQPSTITAFHHIVCFKSVPISSPPDHRRCLTEAATSNSAHLLGALNTTTSS